MSQRRLVTIRLSDEELERIRQVAAHYGLTVASLIRMLTKRESDELRALHSVEEATRARTRRKVERHKDRKPHPNPKGSA